MYINGYHYTNLEHCDKYQIKPLHQPKVPPQTVYMSNVFSGEGSAIGLHKIMKIQIM